MIYNISQKTKSLTFYDKAKLIEDCSFGFSINVLKIPLI